MDSDLIDATGQVADPTILLDEARGQSSGRSSWITGILRKRVHSELAKFTRGELSIIEPGRRVSFGKEREGETTATLYVHHERFYRRLAFGGSLGAAESFLAGDWHSPNLTELVRLFIQNRESFGRFEDSWLTRLLMGITSLQSRFNKNTTKGSRRNIRAHYDLGNDFFQLILDPSMAYSSGIFPRSTSTLQEASEHKFEVIATKLDLKADEQVLEIGCGWGGLATWIAKNYGCRVTGVTISDEQFAFAKSRVRSEGLEDRVEIRLQDYRELEGQYDKLISVEMIEAVGHEYLGAFFRACSQSLKSSGLALIQCITIADPLYDAYRRSVDFIQKYVFPGGLLPSLSRMVDTVKKSTDLRVHSWSQFPQHYAQTLRSWKQRLDSSRGEIRKLGYSEELLRVWDFYLAYCEGAFLEEQISVGHLMLAKPDYRMPACP